MYYRMGPFISENEDGPYCKNDQDEVLAFQLHRHLEFALNRYEAKMVNDPLKIFEKSPDGKKPRFRINPIILD